MKAVQFTSCHSGAKRSFEPGIQSHSSKPLLDSGSCAKRRASGMTSGSSPVMTSQLGTRRVSN